MPTPKAAGIEAVLTAMMEITRQAAASRGICVQCKQPVDEFRDMLSIKEWTISGLCQVCQDRVFGE